MIPLLLVATSVAQETQPPRPDRSHAPEVLPPSILALPDAEVISIHSGLEVVFVRVPQVRDVVVQIKWWQGKFELENPRDPSINLVNALWGYATERYDRRALSELEDLHDMVVVGSVGSHVTTASITVPVEDLDTGLELLEQTVFHPVFPKKDVKRTKEEYARYYALTGPTSPTSVANGLLSYGYVPEDHVYGQRPDPEGLAAISYRSLPPIHAALTAGGAVSILVVGDLPADAIVPQLTRRFGSLGVAQERAQTVKMPTRTGHRVLASALPGGEQVSIMMRLPAPPEGDQEVAMRAIQYALGGHFLSRLNRNLREDKGWTYGVRARYSRSDKDGAFSISVDVPAERFAAAVHEIQAELQKISEEGVSVGEIDALWREEVGNFNNTRATVQTAKNTYAALLNHQRKIADRSRWLQEIKELTPAATQEVASAVLRDDTGVLWAVVGEEKALRAGLHELGWEAEWATPQQAVLGEVRGGPVAKP